MLSDLQSDKIIPEETLSIHFPAALEEHSNLRLDPNCTELCDRSAASVRTSPGEPEYGILMPCFNMNINIIVCFG